MDSERERQLMRKITLRLVPFLLLLYVVAYLDRVNVSYAKLAMGHLSWFGDHVYAFGSGVFFLGYFLFEVPSNLLLQRFGARKWIARIMFTWGAVAMAMALSAGRGSFYSIRFLLGLAEAGFFPGVILYLTSWYTERERAQVVAWLMTANAVAFIIGGPVSGWLLDSHFISRLAPWQWLFVAEGIPAVLLGFVVLLYLPDGPGSARWLTPEESAFVSARIVPDARADSDRHTVREALACPEVWLYCLLYFLMVTGMYGISFWLPTIISTFGHMRKLDIGLLNAIPYIVAGTVMVFNGWHSDRTGERNLHIAVPAAIGGLSLYALSVVHRPVASLVAMSVAAGGMWAVLGPFWSMASARLKGTGAAAGIATINSIGNLGGFLGPFAIGSLTRNHNNSRGLVLLSAVVLLGALVALLGPRRRAQVPVAAAAAE